MPPRIEQFSCFKSAGCCGTSYTNSQKTSHTSRQRGTERELPGGTGTRSKRWEGAPGTGSNRKEGRARKGVQTLSDNVRGAHRRRRGCSREQKGAPRPQEGRARGRRNRCSRAQKEGSSTQKRACSKTKKGRGLERRRGAREREGGRTSWVKRYPRMILSTPGTSGCRLSYKQVLLAVPPNPSDRVSFDRAHDLVRREGERSPPESRQACATRVTRATRPRQCSRPQPRAVDAHCTQPAAGGARTVASRERAELFHLLGPSRSRELLLAVLPLLKTRLRLAPRRVVQGQLQL